MRIDRKPDEKRATRVTDNYLMSPAGSVLIETGNTKVICTASVENSTARHLTGTGKGWVTAEYGMLPGSTGTRKKRDKNKLGERTIWIDCDVIQADGGTRTASITGAYIAMVQAMQWMKDEGMIDEIPVTACVSAISVGIVDGEPLLDLCYKEDSAAQVDMNLVMTDKGEFIELQGTGEEAPFTKDELFRLIELGEKGCRELHQIQKEILEKK